MARALRRGGKLALGAVSAPFVEHNLEDGDDYDAGVYREQAVVRNAAGEERAFALCTICYDAAELHAAISRHGLRVMQMQPPDRGRPDLLVIAEKTR
jgi:hypothetical protein